MTRTVWFTEIESPAGPLRLARGAEGLRRLDFLASPRARPRPADWVRDPSALAETVGQLQDYFGGRRRKSFIAGNGRGLADHGNRACGAGRAVAVDHQPRIALRDQMRVHLVGEPLGDAGNADVPGDVARQFTLGQSEITQHARDRPSVMVTGEQKRRAAGCVIFADRRNIFGA